MQDNSTTPAETKKAISGLKRTRKLMPVAMFSKLLINTQAN